MSVAILRVSSIGGIDRYLKWGKSMRKIKLVVLGAVGLGLAVGGYYGWQTVQAQPTKTTTKPVPAKTQSVATATTSAGPVQQKSIDLADVKNGSVEFRDRLETTNQIDTEIHHQQRAKFEKVLPGTVDVTLSQPTVKATADARQQDVWQIKVPYQLKLHNGNNAATPYYLNMGHLIRVTAGDYTMSAEAQPYDWVNGQYRTSHGTAVINLPRNSAKLGPYQIRYFQPTGTNQTNIYNLY